MLRAFGIIFAVILLIAGFSFIASRGGHEIYKARYFKPGPAIGLLKGLSDDRLEGRLIGSPGSKHAQNMITARMSALELLSIGNDYGHPFTIKAETDAHAEVSEMTTFSGVNLIGGVQGKNDSARVIVITAHFDHVGVIDGQVYNGADDNASGVAALLALAQHFKGRKNQPEHSLLFIALDGEENGFLGARGFMANPPLPKETLVFNINLDMVARADNGTLWASGASHTPALEPLLRSFSTTTPLKLDLGFDGSREDQDDWTEQSDHAVFHDADIPYLYFGVEDHPDYHQPTDEFEKINQDTFLKSVDTIIMVTEAIDEQLETLFPPTSSKPLSTLENQ